MSFRNVFIGFTLVMLGCWMSLSGCSGSGDADSLSNQLVGNTFQVELAEPDTSLSLDCLTDLDTPEATSDISPEMAALTVELKDVLITFSESEYSIEENGEITSGGTWIALDGNTIDITEDGISAPFDVSVDGDSLILEVTQESIDVLCDISADISDIPFATSDTVDDSPSPDDSANSDNADAVDTTRLTSVLAGTWCLESGYVFYLSIAIPTEGIVNTSFASFDASVVIDSGSDPIVRDLGINEFLQSAWISTGRLSDNFHRYAPISLNETDSTVLTIEFGDGKQGLYRKSVSQVLGVCEEAEPPLIPANETPAAEQVP